MYIKRLRAIRSRTFQLIQEPTRYMSRMEELPFQVRSFYSRFIFHVDEVTRGICFQDCYSVITNTLDEVWWLKGKLRWFGLVESKDDTDWLEHCTTIEVEGTQPSKRPRKTRWVGVVTLPVWNSSHSIPGSTFRRVGNCRIESNTLLNRKIILQIRIFFRFLRDLLRLLAETCLVHVCPTRLPGKSGDRGQFSADGVRWWSTVWRWERCVHVRGAVSWTAGRSFSQHCRYVFIALNDFCRAMLCISAAYAVMCLCVCLSRSWIMSKRINISSKFLHLRVAPPF